MERKTNIITICALYCLLLPIGVMSQKQYSEQIYNAYITGNMNQWEQVISTIENSGTPTLDSKLELAEYYYAHIGYLLGVGNKTQAKIYLSRAENLIERTLNDAPGNPTATSLKGIFVAYRMEMNKIKAPVLGPQCMKLIKKAWQTDPGNVQAVSDLGNMYYHAPGVFGGDKSLGMQYLYKAVNILEENGEDSGNWFYLNLLTMLAQYEDESGSKTTAKQLYDKILRIEPNFVWIRDELYPAFLVGYGR